MPESKGRPPLRPHKSNVIHDPQSDSKLLASQTPKKHHLPLPSPLPVYAAAQGSSQSEQQPGTASVQSTPSGSASRSRAGSAIKPVSNFSEKIVPIYGVIQLFYFSIVI